MTNKLPNISHPRFPRSSSYDAGWVLRNQMGPNALWLTELLFNEIELRPDMRVLDLGCGTAISSIFLAREFNVQVWAADLWLDPSDNLSRIREAGLDRKVFPLRTDANKLPFAANFFDAIISVDAWNYFGYDADFLPKLARHAKQGTQVAVAIPGLTQEISEVPEHLARKRSSGEAFWADECDNWHSPEWWQSQWRRSGVMSDVQASLIEKGWQLWVDSEAAAVAAGFPVPCLGTPPGEADLAALREDEGRYLGLVKVVGKVG